MNHIIKIFSITLIFIITFSAVKATTSDVELLRKKVIAELMIPTVDEAHVKVLMATIRPDGTWPEINYQDVSNTGFQHSIHLDNLVEMSRAYKKKDSKLKGDPQIKKVIYSALDYWLANNFICENWWWNQIGTPNALVSMLLIMDTDLTRDQVSKTLPMAGRANLDATGARPSGDRIKIAGILAKTLLFKHDEAQFNEVIRVIEGEIKFAVGRGMQYDYSFHHRVDRVNNTLSYGTGYADAFAEWAAFVAGTKYQFSAPALHLLTDYYLDGICKMMIYGKYTDPGAMNRDITRPDSQRVFGTATPERLLTASGYRKNELEDIIKIRHGEAQSTLVHSTFYWQSEHFTFQRPGFFTSVRMYSNRDYNMEMPYNGEGLMNHHRGDGTNYISRSGDEYYDLAPVYDWQKIPGTTIVQKPELPSEKEIQKKGLTDFVGAVTDGKYGAVVFDFKSPHDPLEAKKSWFFFDKEYVCLGTGINSESPFPVATTINQCSLKGDVLVRSNNQTAELTKGIHELSGVQWILHDGIAYLFPQPVKLNASNQPEKGSWYRINHQSDSPRGEISMDVFKIWFNHGVKPENASYQYIVVPSTNAKEMEDQPDRKIAILANTAEIQAVQHTGLNISEVVFYQAGQIRISGDLNIGIDSPGLVLVRTEGSKLKTVSVADPTRKLGRIHLSVTEKIDKKGLNFSSSWNNEKGISEITIDLPLTVYAGKSVTIEL
jgi:chondroitin AC lyase